MITFMESKEKVKETEKCLDSQLWHACAGSMVQMPSINSNIFYFPQGHSEHASCNIDFRHCPKIPSYVPCKVSAVKFMADPETDEVFAKIQLFPIKDNNFNDNNGEVEINGPDKPVSFAKTLTQSDANNGGGFSVPRYCAETIFPRLDYLADPPVQTILVKDVHGEIWKFRHIYRGTPRRHLLTTGWSTFVNHKKLVAGDSIVFLRADNGDLCVGIRRAKRGGLEMMSTGWNPTVSGPYNDNGSLMSREGVKVKGDDVIEAATLAADGEPFSVVYYPRASTPEFCVKATLVKAAMQVRWCSGMRFKMAFETEDSSRISWFMGSVSLVRVADPIRWPDSPWRLLQVSWDEPDLLQNVKRLSPWLVELVSNMHTIHLSPFSPPVKKMRLPHHPDSPFDSQIPLRPSFSSNPFGCIPVNTPAGMQGARHAQYGLSLSNLHSGFLPPYVPIGASNHFIPKPNDNISCLLTIGNSNLNSTRESKRVSDNGKVSSAPFLLFGQEILTEKQISLSCNSCNSDKIGNTSDKSDGFDSLESGHCQVFMESEDVGRTLDLSLLGSYEELHKKLEDMFGIESLEMVKNVTCWDATGAVRQLGDEPFSNFKEKATRLTIVSDSNSDNVGV